MALRWSTIVAEHWPNTKFQPSRNEEPASLNHHPHTPKSPKASGLWQYSIWTYDAAAESGLRHPQPAVHKNKFFAQYSMSTNSSATSIDMEKAQPSELPPKRHSRLLRNIRWTWFSVYRRLNFLVLLPNILVMIILGCRHNLLDISLQAATIGVSANIAAAILIRQELVINLLFGLFGKMPQWFPLRIRRLAAKIYHLGGVHSGCGIAATFWFALFNVIIFQQEAHNIIINQVPISAITIIIDVLLVSILIMALPALRSRFHNAFEAVHRFAGWLAVGLFWSQFLVLADVVRKTQDPRPSYKIAVFGSPVFYFLLLITVSLIIPWLRLRSATCHAEHLSAHATRLHFTHCNLPLCAAPRISTNPLLEWHAFAGIPEKDGKGFSVIVSKAGDWTSKIIEHPPTKLWVRGIPAKGVLHVAPIFKMVVLVATGSGIGPILSLIQARGLNCRILWSTQDPTKTYQQSIVDTVRIADPNAVIINTSVSGRPDLVQEAFSLFKAANAEAVFIISNPNVTRNVVYSLESRGIPTFAPIFDS